MPYINKSPQPVSWLRCRGAIGEFALRFSFLDAVSLDRTRRLVNKSLYVERSGSIGSGEAPSGCWEHRWQECHEHHDSKCSRLWANLEQQMILELRWQFRHAVGRRVYHAEVFVLAVITDAIFAWL